MTPVETRVAILEVHKNNLEKDMQELIDKVESLKKTLWALGLIMVASNPKLLELLIKAL